MTIRALCAAALAAAVLSGCGAEEPAGGDSAEGEAVEAQEQNTVELAGVRYRVKIFRQLNPRIAPDRALYEGPAGTGERAIFAAFLEACNVSDETQQPTTRIRLEDAFGESYARLQARSRSGFDYEPRRLGPGDCLPPADSAADRAFPGAAVLFGIPFDRLGNRPFVLELRDREAATGSVVRRIELDV